MENVNSYFPSNGTEGDWFIHTWCAGCRRDTSLRKMHGKVFCSILSNSLAGKRPKQWKYIDGKPVCTSFKTYKGAKPGRSRSPKNQLTLFP